MKKSMARGLHVAKVALIIQAKFQVVYRFLNGGNLPERLAEADDWHSRFCFLVIVFRVAGNHAL